MRFVLQHMRPSERSLLLRTLNQYMGSGSILIITEPDDSEIQYFPESKNIQTLIGRTIQIQAERGGDRTIAGKLADELQKSGFNEVVKRKYTLNTKNLSPSQLIEIILPVWKSYKANESKAELDSQLEDAKKWINEQAALQTLDFEFPIYIFTATKEALK